MSDIPRPGAPEPKPAMREAADIADASMVEPTLATQMCIVISFNIPADSPEASYEHSREILQQVKGVLGGKEGVLVWGAVHETAAAIVKVLNEGVEEQEEALPDEEDGV